MELKTVKVPPKSPWFNSFDRYITKQNYENFGWQMKIKINQKVKNKIVKITPFLQKQFPTYDRFLIINLEIVHFHRNRVLFERV